MRQRRGHIKPLQRVMIACEGKGEEAYAALLATFVKAAGLAFHLDAVPLNPGAGDPLALIIRAVKEKKKYEALRGPYVIRVALLDLDRVINDQPRREQTEKLAKENGINIIWQNICHETVLLHHLEGFQEHHPATAADSVKKLKAQWEDYDKPMTQVKLSKRLDLEAVKRAAKVEAALADLLLHKIGLI